MDRCTHQFSLDTSVQSTICDPIPTVFPRTLVIMVCHPDSAYRVDASFCTITNVMSSFSGTGVRPTIWVVVSEGAKCAEMLRTYMDDIASSWIDAPNSEWLDYGKLEFVSTRIDRSAYDRIIVVNDSIILVQPVPAFINLVLHSQQDMVGFMNSDEVRPHYPTFLFGLTTPAFFRMIGFIRSVQAVHPPSREACIHEIEVNLSDQFDKKVAHLVIRSGDLRGRNVFYECDKVYSLVIGEVPIIKLRRILQKRRTPFDHRLRELTRTALNE